MRVLVAVEAVDLRQGIDSLAQLCREKLAADPFSGCLFVFRSRSATSLKILVYDRAGILVGAETAVERSICVVADRNRSRAETGSAPGAGSVNRRQPCRRSGADVA